MDTVKIGYSEWFEVADLFGKCQAAMENIKAQNPHTHKRPVEVLRGNLSMDVDPKAIVMRLSFLLSHWDRKSKNDSHLIISYLASTPETKYPLTHSAPSQHFAPIHPI